MNKQELLKKLETLGMRPGRGLGQNFLLDGNLLDFIVKQAAPAPGETVLEVGPGFGALTERLLATGAEVYAVEFDHRVCDFLRKNRTEPNFHLTEGDGCRVDYASLLPEGEFRAIANLPYAVSSILVARFLELARPPRQMIFMLQKEMAERLAARPGQSSYGALSVRVQQLYEVKVLRIVPPEVFYPAPGVDSALAEFRLRDGAVPEPEEREKLEKIVKLVFSNRRKQMGKVLKQRYPEERIRSAFAAVGIAWEVRPERLSVAEFEALIRAFEQA